MNSLLEYNLGGGYCHAWYSRRFLSSVDVQETCAPHSGLGLSSYVQWTSPIRRYSDLLVHNSVKRYLRRERLYQLIQQGQPIPDDLTESDIGCPVPRLTDDNSKDISDNPAYAWDTSSLDSDIDYREGAGLIGASRVLQRQSQQYWLFEYIRRLHDDDPDVTFDALVLGWVPGPPNKKQYAIYVYELALEHKFSSPVDHRPGDKLKLAVAYVIPRNHQLHFVQVNL